MSHRVALANRAPVAPNIGTFGSRFMATIRTRQRRGGTLAYLSEVRIKRDGEIIHRESKTFDRIGQAKAWADSREMRFAKKRSVTKRPQKAKQSTLRNVFREYREEVSEVRPMGRSKTRHIRSLEKCEIARMAACEIKSSDVFDHVRTRDAYRTTTSPGATRTSLVSTALEDFSNASFRDSDLGNLTCAQGSNAFGDNVTKTSSDCSRCP